jgi:hypothetical protein
MSSGLFAKIESREEAIRIARDCGTAFGAVAIILTVASPVLGVLVLIDAALYATCAFFIHDKYSRTAAVAGSLLSLASFVIAFLNLLGGGGSLWGVSILGAWIFVVIAIRSVQATFLLHGRFSRGVGKPQNEETLQPTTEVPPVEPERVISPEEAQVEAESWQGTATGRRWRLVVVLLVLVAVAGVLLLVVPRLASGPVNPATSGTQSR